jgi:hypothetical protein
VVRENLWRSMRILRSFTRGQLAAVVEREPGSVSRYVTALHRAGYLRRTQIIEAGRRGASWRLVRDTGPVAPVLRRNGTVYDPNNDTLYREGLRSSSAGSRV